MIPHILPKYPHCDDCGPFRKLMSQVNTKNLRLLNSVFDDAHNYCADAPADKSSEQEKCIGARTHGLASMRAAGIEMNAVAAENLAWNMPENSGSYRIHPETFKSHHIAWSKKTLHLAARESEIKYGWSHDDGIYVVELDSNNQKHIVLNKKYVNGRMSWKIYLKIFLKKIGRPK